MSRIVYFSLGEVPLLLDWNFEIEKLCGTDHQNLLH